MLLLVLALGCRDKGADDTAEPAETGETGETGDTGPAGEGQVAVTFAMDPDYIDVMDEVPVGRFWGTIWRGEDVTGVGPNDGAEGLEDIYIESLDVTGGRTPTAVLHTSGALPAGEICVLGFLDSDNNSDESASPDEGDPVTLPGDNRFTVVADETTTIEVFFGFLNP